MLWVDGRTDLVQQEVIKALPDLTGIPFVAIEKAMERVQNCPGSNPPLMYVISKLVAEGKVRSILEFGSGGTTILFSHLADKYGLKYISFENADEWEKKTRLAAKFSGTSPIGLFSTPSFFNDSVSDLNLNNRTIINKITDSIDLLFIDSSPGQTRLDALNIYNILLNKKQLFHKETIVMVDDCESSKPEQEARNIVGNGKVFMSHTRGIYTVDPANKIDFVIYR